MEILQEEETRLCMEEERVALMEHATIDAELAEMVSWMENAGSCMLALKDN